MNSSVATLRPEKLPASSLTSTFSSLENQAAPRRPIATAYAFREQTASYMLLVPCVPSQFTQGPWWQMCPVCPVGSASMAFGQERVQQRHRAPLAERVVGVPAFG